MQHRPSSAIPAGSSPAWAAVTVAGSPAPGPDGARTAAPSLWVPVAIGPGGVVALVPARHPVVESLRARGRARLEIHGAGPSADADGDPAAARPIVTVEGPARLGTADVPVLHAWFRGRAGDPRRPSGPATIPSGAHATVALHVHPSSVTSGPADD
jgi:hypothetical protein